MSKTHKGCKPQLMVFGEPCYLVHKFDDVDKATVSRKSAMSRLVKDVVKGLATKKDDMYVYRVLATSGKIDGAPVKGYVAHVAIGLNGPGKQADYLAAVKRLVECKTVKMHVIDVWVDAVDDLMDVLVSCSAPKEA